MRSLRNASQSGNKQKLFMSEIQLFFITDITNLIFAYEHPLNEEWENKLLIKNHYIYIDDKLLRYLADSLAWVNFSVDNKDVVYQGLDFEGVNTLYPNQITSFKKLILAWIVLFENASQTFDLNRFNQTQTFDKSTVLKQLYQLVEFCQIVENNPNKCLVHIGL